MFWEASMACATSSVSACMVDYNRIHREEQARPNHSNQRNSVSDIGHVQD